MSLSGITVAFKKLNLFPVWNIRPFLAATNLIVQQNAGKSTPVGKIRRFKYPPTQYRRLVKKPEKYTTDPIPVQRLGGRDPETGRVVVRTIGGGQKHSFYWVDFKRNGPTSGTPLVEKVHLVKPDFVRTGHIALVASGDKKRWILATENMKPGDLVKTSGEIPRNAVRPVEGNAHPLGALPLGTTVNSVERFAGQGGYWIRAAGTCGQVLRKVGNMVVVQLPSKLLVSVSENCMAVVGRVSNPTHGSTPIGSARANRWLGNRPRSGHWHRKDGHCGRKIKPTPPMRVYVKPKEKALDPFQLTL